MAHYVIRASGKTGAMAFNTPLNAADAYSKAVELRDQGYRNITFKVVETGATIENIEQLLRDDPNS